MQKNPVWVLILILTPLVLSISFSMDIYVPSLPLIIRNFHTSQQAVQWTLSIYMFGVGLGQLFVGPLSDWLGRRKVVLTGLLVYLAGTLVCFFANSISILVIGRLLQSMGTCAALVVAFAVVKDLYDTKTSANIYSILNAATAVGPVIAPLLGGYLQMGFHTWRASFAFLFLFTAISLLTTFFFLKETWPLEKRIPLKPKELKLRFKSILSSRLFLQNAYFASVGLTVLFVFCCISSYLLIVQLHATQPQYGLTFASNAIIFILANILSTRLSKHHLRLPIRLGCVLLFIGSLFMLILNLTEGLSLFHFMLPMWVITLGAGLLMGPAVAIALENFSHVSGTATSLINASQFLFAGTIGTLLMLHTVTSAVPFAVVLVLLALFSLLWLSKKRRNPSITTE